MSASTSKLSLTMPGGGSHGDITPGEPVDIDVINDNMRTLDNAAGANTYTSATRPGTPFNGQLIRESDTQRLKLFNGTTWVNADDVGTSKVFYSTASVDTTTTDRDLFVAPSYTPTVGHTYSVTAKIQGNVITASVVPSVELMDGPLATTAFASLNRDLQLLGITSYPLNANVGGSGVHFFTATSATPVFFRIAGSGSGTGALRVPAGGYQIAITDLGVAT